MGVAVMDGYLAQVPLFRTLPRRELKRVSDVCELQRFRKGQEVFQEGHPAGWVWVIKRGWVHLVKRTSSGQATTIFTITPEEAVCGISAFDHGTYSTAAVCATDTQVVRIPGGTFLQLVERSPRFAREVLLTCCRRMRHMAEAISLSQAPAQQRLAYVLLRLRAGFGETVPVTHQELAQMAGVRWETSIRVLSAMRRNGWLKSSRGKISIVAPAALRTALRRDGRGTLGRAARARQAI